MPAPSIQGTFSWPLFIVFLVFFLPWCWYTGKSVRAVLLYEKAVGTIQEQTYVPPTAVVAPSRHINERSGSYAYKAVFTVRETAWQVQARVRSNPPNFEIGDRVTVYYDPRDPSKALIGTFLELWLPTLALGFFAGIFFILWLGALLEPSGGRLPMAFSSHRGPAA